MPQPCRVCGYPNVNPYCDEHQPTRRNDLNWRLEADASSISDAELVVERAEDEDDKATPDTDTVSYAKQAASKLAEKLGAKQAHITVQGHETTTGKGFRPGHVTVTVSKVKGGA